MDKINKKQQPAQIVLLGLC